jgi:tetratricopeptide (TPR) repeat protein
MTQRLSADDPGNTELLRNLSVAYAKIGVTLTRTGNWADAVDNYRQSADLRRQLVDRDPGNWQWRALLAEAIEGTGVALAHAGRLDEGKGLLTDAIARYREVAQHDPRNAIARRDLARALNQYAVAILSTDRAGALTAAHESLAIFRGLVQGDSPPASALVDVAITMLTVADAGEDTRKNYEGSLAILRALDQQGTLPPGMRASMKSIEAYLDKLPKP